jgi:hypothetical protein
MVEKPPYHIETAFLSAVYNPVPGSSYNGTSFSGLPMLLSGSDSTCPAPDCGVTENQAGFGSYR